MNETNARFFFTVTLPSRHVMSDTEVYEELFTGTLLSIFGQTTERFTVLVACHEVPETRLSKDPRLVFLPVAYPVPSTFEEKFEDKSQKRRLMAMEIGRRGGGYMFHVDYDDRVHRDVCRFVLDDRDPNGYVIAKGYEYDVGRDRIVRYPRIPFIQPSFDRICGTSTILRFVPGDLPAGGDGAPCRFDRYQRNHHVWAARARREGRPLKALPFRGAAWLINSRLNLSSLTGSSGPRVTLFRHIARWRRPTAAERSTFGLRPLIDPSRKDRGPALDLD